MTCAITSVLDFNKIVESAININEITKFFLFIELNLMYAKFNVFFMFIEFHQFISLKCTLIHERHCEDFFSSVYKYTVVEIAFCVLSKYIYSINNIKEII